MEESGLTGRFNVDLILYFNKLRVLGGDSFAYLGNYVNGDDLFYAGPNSILTRIDFFYNDVNRTCIQIFGDENGQERKVEIKRINITGEPNSREKSKKFLEKLLKKELIPEI